VRKSPSYQVHGRGNLLGIQDKKDYAKKKRIFQQGFSDTALRRLEPKVIREINVFCDKMTENESSKEGTGGWSKAKNINLWCKHSN
jgi:cytochrome P450